MTDATHWITNASHGSSLREYRFQIDQQGRSIPGHAWLPRTNGRLAPLVLLGHGGSGHKRAELLTDLGEWFAIEAGIASVAIDGPYHGDRVPAPMSAADYQARNIQEGVETVVDRMVDDWAAAVKAVQLAGLANVSRLGYIGMSMGARFGIPTAAALGSSLTCAVFGKFGLQQADPYPSRLVPLERTRSEAGHISAPTLLHCQWDDEIFPRSGQFQLFAALGSQGKQLLAHPGGHGETKPTAVRSWREFIASFLTQG
jgi:dienelactone hydrolase